MIRGMENTRPMAANGLTQTGALVTHTAHERAIAYACGSADVRACVRARERAQYASNAAAATAAVVPNLPN